MTCLHVVDMSPCIYAGSVNTRSFIPGGILNTPTGYREQRIPTGGTSMLFNILAQYMGTGPIMFVADRNPTIKKELYATYKGSRTHPNNVQVSKEVAEFILADCGFTIYAEDGYEADDLIYSIVITNKHKFDKVCVHTADSDLFLLVDKNVEILPAHSRAKHVTMENYPYQCLANKTMPYNAVVFEKFLKGDHSKDIPALDKQTQQRLVSMFCTPQMLPHLGKAAMMSVLMQKHFPELSDRLTLFYPLMVPRDFSPHEEGNPERIKQWAFEIGNRKIPGKRGDLTEPIQELLRRSLYLD